jgi:hypothetical protein
MVKDRTTAFFVGSLVAFLAMGSVLSLYHPSGASGDGFAWATYTSDTQGFVLRYPADYTVDGEYIYDIGPGRVARGVSFTVPPDLTEGSNLSSDTRITVESIPELSSCHAAQYLNGAAPENEPFVDEGVTYTFGSEADAGAGNRYENIVFVRSDSGPCIAVRYFIHSTAVENYEPGAVYEFDREGLINEFDMIRRSIERI